MRRIASLAALSTSIAMLALAACRADPVVTTPAPVPTAVPTERPTGGWCGDGTQLKPGEHCP